MARSRWCRVGTLAISAAVLAGGGVALGQSPPTASPPARPASFGGALALDIASATDGSLVMVGAQGTDPNRPQDAVAWYSADGMQWDLIVLPKSRGYGAGDVAFTARGWVALASSGGGTVPTWVSADGQTWKGGSPIKGAADVSAVIAVGDGALVAGSIHPGDGTQQPAIWSTANLKKWKPTGLDGRGTATDLGQTAPGVTVVLIDDPQESGSQRVDRYRYATSVDGQTWQSSDFPVVAGDGEKVTAGDLAVTGDLFIQLVDVRTADALTGSIWTSTDGSTWTEAYSGSDNLSVAASGPVGEAFGSGVRVTSPDGVTWTRTAQPDLTNPGQAATAVPDGRVFLAGYAYGSNGFSVVLNSVAAPAGFVPPASPGPVPSPASGASPAASGPPLGEGPTDPLCDPLLTSATVSAVTGVIVASVNGSTFGDALSCHFAVTGESDLILAMEPGLLADRQAQAVARGAHKAPDVGKTGYLTTDPVNGDPVVVWGRKAKGSNQGYALTLGGGGLDEAQVIALAKAVTLP